MVWAEDAACNFRLVSTSSRTPVLNNGSAAVKNSRGLLYKMVVGTSRVLNMTLCLPTFRDTECFPYAHSPLLISIGSNQTLVTVINQEIELRCSANDLSYKAVLGTQRASI
ncbi:hypothetical protein EDE15_4085 [Edaphobacter aggregans]|uniref:Uncharacterized protein n=1 Tax=Edaphobacter aggregans TaxID=570835 RepID=A0A3R9P0X0_9BACT|nr:hypothetical protein EDE15_4085 [Edaphobacter aggregans]